MVTAPRRAHETLWTAALLAALIAAGVFVSRRLGHETPEDTSRPAGAQPVMILFARDGDTLDASAREPGSVIATTDRVQLRLLGIDAPETHGVDGRPQCYAREGLDPYRRFLVYAWTADGLFVNGELARLGFARSLVIPPERRATILTFPSRSRSWLKARCGPVRASTHSISGGNDRSSQGGHWPARWIPSGERGVPALSSQMV